ncbi:MAG: signal peptidase I [Alphaproteobacteria bacterium]|nr:signal peptidase I [Alphaproteobacteria bacterium]
MTSETSAEQPVADKKSFGERVIHEIRETAMTIAVFVPFWLVFSTFVYELRSIPSESMVPALQVGDRVAVAKFAYGYDRNSVPFGLGRLFIGDDKSRPDQKAFSSLPKRGDVIVFQHPNDPKVMIKRIIGLPGDTVQYMDGKLNLNGAEVPREEVRATTYVQSDSARMLRTATEYLEQLPGEAKAHRIHEFSDDECLDRTPIFRVPDGHVFMMGDNRDNSEDSRASSGHPNMAAAFPEAWNCRAISGGEMAVGFVPLDHLIGRAETVLFTLHGCRRADGAECAAPRLWRGL